MGYTLWYVSMTVANYCLLVGCLFVFFMVHWFAEGTCALHFLPALLVRVLSSYFLSLPRFGMSAGNTPSRRNASKWTNRHSLRSQMHQVHDQKIIVTIFYCLRRIIICMIFIGVSYWLLLRLLLCCYSEFMY